MKKNHQKTAWRVLLRPSVADVPNSWLSKLGKLLGVSIITSLLVACGLQEFMIEPAAEQVTPTTSENAVERTPVVESEEIPDMEETSVQETTLETELCYLFTVANEAQLGGSETTLSTTYLTAEGFIQTSEETSYDNILELREGSVDAGTLFARAQDIAFTPETPAKSTVTPRPDDSNIVTEYYAPNHHIRLGSCDGSLVEEWSGPIDSAPGEVAKMATDLQELAAQALPVEQSTGRYLRAQHLSAQAVSNMKEADIITAISAEKVESDELLKRVIENPYRLIEIPESSDSDAAETTLQTGRSLNVLYEGQGYQIRQLVQDTS